MSIVLLCYGASPAVTAEYNGDIGVPEMPATGVGMLRRAQKHSNGVEASTSYDPKGFAHCNNTTAPSGQEIPHREANCCSPQ
eukprot:5943891-Amphidinium_carterae.1